MPRWTTVLRWPRLPWLMPPGTHRMFPSRNNKASAARPAVNDANQPRQPYTMSPAFEEPTFRFLCEGVDIDYKKEVREALLKIVPPRRKNFTVDTNGMDGESVQQTVRLFRALCQTHDLVSYAQVRSTPHRLASFYETVATADAPLALMAADHFTAAGLISTHGSTTAQRQVLNDVDTARQILCIAQRELIADGVPFNTEARYDVYEKCFVLRGTGKYSIVAAATADAALVVATLTLNKNENCGPHVFLVPLRHRGALAKGVRISPISGEGSLFSRTGAAVIHFDEVRIPADYMLDPFCVTAKGTVEYVAGKEGFPPAMDVLRTRSRLASGALYAGTLKKILSDVVPFVFDRDTVGHDHRRNYPYIGLQHVQTPLVSLMAKSFVYLEAWQRLLPSFCDVSNSRSQPDYEDEMRLAGTIHFLQESIMDAQTLAQQFMGTHALLTSTGVASAAAVVQLRKEGIDQSTLIREVAFQSITKNIGTTHWGWWLTSLLESIPSVDRLIKNPFYSPRIADLGRHLIFFGHKHNRTKRALRLSRELERRKGGSEHQWYDWAVFRHGDVVHCGEAYMEVYFIDLMMKETQNCTDPRGRKILRDIGWVYSLARQKDRLSFLMTGAFMTPHVSSMVAPHLDNLSTVLAPQCVNLVDAMQVPRAFRSPCGLDQARLEAYWTIPGTSTHFHRGDRVVVFKAEEYKDSRSQKAEQESIREEPAEFDLFHGLAKEPSHTSR